MDKKKAFLTCISFAGLAAFIRSSYEVRQLKMRSYKLSSDKLPSGTAFKLIFISDLHGRVYGKNDQKLINMVKKEAPDYILIGGDLITAKKKADDAPAFFLLSELKKIAPVYYAIGNHEEYLKTERYRFDGRFDTLRSFLEKEDIELLGNKHADLKGNISVYGLELPKKYYRRLNIKKPKPSDMEKYLGKPDLSRYNILLAHMPAFFDVYETFKSDLVLSGHYHGGVVGLPPYGREKRRGLISPGFKLFPKYCAGRFRKNDTELIVSSGCGSHTINIRLFNKPEVVSIELSSEA